LQSYITIEVIFLDLLIPGFLSQWVATRPTCTIGFIALR
jgi:hypothetical protein